jgi:14-3-3 protein epsilon
MKVRMADLWKPVKGVTIKVAPAGKFLFHFNHPLDMEAVLSGGPWTFDNNMLILERAQLGMQLEHIPLHHVNMWVQVHDLPMGFMREKVGIKLADYIGAFVEYDKNNNSSFWRQHMRIRVKIDVRKPLKKEFKVKNKEGAWCTVRFKYEKLGVFCFVCGIMGHAENKCEILFAKEQDDGVRGWSADIRADLRRQGRTTSKWLREETIGSKEEDGNTSPGNANFPVRDAHVGYTDAEVSSLIPINSHNHSIDNQSSTVPRQHQSLPFNALSTQPIINRQTDPTPINPTGLSFDQNANSPVNSSHILSPVTIHQNVITQSFKAADTINYSCPPFMPFTSSSDDYPLILNKPQTESNKTSSLANQTLTFNSRPINPVKKVTAHNMPHPIPKPALTLTRPRPDNKNKNTKTKPNPTQTRSLHLTGHANSEDMDSQCEKKRRREDESSTSNTSLSASEHFLSAGPGSQTCRDQ